MWGGDSESDVAEVDRLLSAGARALGTRSVPTVIRDRDARSVPPTELAEHRSRSIGAALAAGRATAEEVERARDLLRRAEQERDEAKAALDRVDEEIGAARDRRRQVTTPGNVRRHNRAEIERFQARTREEAAGLERRLREIERWHRDLCRSVAEQDAFHLERTQEAHRRRAADTHGPSSTGTRASGSSPSSGDGSGPRPWGIRTTRRRPGPPPCRGPRRSRRRSVRCVNATARPGTRRAGDREEPSSGQPIGFALPAGEPAPSDPAEGREDAASADGESPWSPPPIGFAFPSPDAEGTDAS
jgi:hypothetical protein